MPNARVKAKKAVNVSINPDLLQEAKDAGTNVSAVLERALTAELREHRIEKWRKENKAAIEEYNHFIAENGLLSDEWPTT